MENPFHRLACHPFPNRKMAIAGTLSDTQGISTVTGSFPVGDPLGKWGIDKIWLTRGRVPESQIQNLRSHGCSSLVICYSYWKWPCVMGKTTISTGPFSIAMEQSTGGYSLDIMSCHSRSTTCQTAASILGNGYELTSLETRTPVLPNAAGRNCAVQCQ